ncbi:hypothetical protein [Aquimarina sp. RZ0]|uniref:hypothetical protein n=1 Tax=Aquimarina sp. RZ0 TaxID=2607730 RepID=UPI0011F2EF42|nr:hypothetical protein [Aquimarina sp. RZ0]KAA1245185.1 hypothetical protein F0000_13110 [Aquimarina sp. RZ0]
MSTFKIIIFFISTVTLLVSCEKENEFIDSQLAVRNTSFSIDELVSEINNDTYLYFQLLQIQQMNTEKESEELTYLFEDMAAKYNIGDSLDDPEITAVFIDTFFSLFEKIRNSDIEEKSGSVLSIDPNCFAGRHSCCGLFGEAKTRCFEIYCPDLIVPICI